MDEEVKTIMPASPPHRGHWRIAFMLLLVLPFVPELAVLAAGGVAEYMGCRVEDAATCVVAGMPVSDVIALALEAGVYVGSGFGVGLAALWLAFCFIALSQGWGGTGGRLGLGAVAAIIIGLLPYIGPLLALVPFVNDNCYPNEGGVGPCRMFGGEVGIVAHAAATLPWFVFFGVPLALGVYAIFAITLGVIRFIAARRAAAPAP